MKESIDGYRQREKLQCLRIDQQQMRIEVIEKDRQKTNELVTELIKKIADMQISLKNEVQENKKQNNPTEIVPAYSADHRYQSNL